jgi:4-hydroxybenzoate polyprenyltransferase
MGLVATDQIIRFIKISRPSGWLFAPLVFLVGFTYYAAICDVISVVQIVLLSFPYSFFLYGVNDIFDIKSDQINPRKDMLDKKRWDDKTVDRVKRIAFIFMGLLIFSALLTLNPWNILGMVLLLFFSYQYSAPPFRLKEKPPLDSFSNGIIYYYGPFLIGASYNSTVFQFPVHVYVIFAAVMGIHSFSTVMDYTSDKLVGSKTFAVVFGKRFAAFFGLLMFCLTLFFPGFQIASIAFYLMACILFSAIIVIYPSERVAHIFHKLMGFLFIILVIIIILSYIGLY